MKNKSNNAIYPCLILKGRAAEAADFYTETFGEGKISNSAPVVVFIELSGQQFMLLNDGPDTAPNAAISFMVACRTPEEAQQYWDRLSVGGKSMMPLDSYPWSEKYGWIEDKYGVSWQLYTDSKSSLAQKFSPSLMFTGTKAGKAAEALHFYTGIFPDSAIEGMMEYTEDDGDTTGFVKHAQFTLNDFVVMAMDSSADHQFDFNDAVSLVVNCDTQDEIDRYWDHLTADGGQEVQCGWLIDKYNVRWQIVPNIIGELVTDPQRAPRVMNAVMKMKKLIIADLVNA